jgi:DnaJ family protein C protein 8
MASSSTSRRAPASNAATDDIDKLLTREATSFQREVEVERILSAFKLNPYDILDLDLSAKADDIKKKYRQISLCKRPLSPRTPRRAEASSWRRRLWSVSLMRVVVCPMRCALRMRLVPAMTIG